MNIQEVTGFSSQSNRANCYSKDIFGRYLYVNQTQVECIQITSGQEIGADDILGRNDREFPWQKDHAEDLIKNDYSVVQTGASCTFIESGPFNGVSGYYRSFKSPILGRSGKIIGLQGISVPISNLCLVPLTKQQTACLKQLAFGFTHKQIGQQLGLSQKTVEHYFDAVKMKLDCKSRSDLILQAIERGLIGFV